MNAATIAVSVLLAGVLAYSAALKLSRREAVVAAYARAGVPEARLNLLAAVLLAGAAGVLVGLVLAPIGIAAAACLVVYFLFAIVAHVRAGDTGNLMAPTTMALVSATALLLRLITA